MRRPTIFLQLHTGLFSRFIGEMEMRSILQNKHGYEVGKRHKNKKFNRVVIRLIDPGPEPLRSFKEASPPSITSSEMQANVGIGEIGQIRAARAKVKEFRVDSPRHIIKPVTE